MINKIMPTDSNFTKSPVFLYGAGRICKDFVNICYFLGIYPDYICDHNSNLWGKYIEDLQIISPDEMKTYGLDNPVIVTNCWKHSSICTLEKHGFTNIWVFPHIGTGGKTEAIINENKSTIKYVLDNLHDERSRFVLNEILRFRVDDNLEIVENIYEDEQYFPADIVSLSDNEVFIDGGAYNGSDTVKFIDNVRNCFNHIYVFEPQPKMVEHLRTILHEHIEKNRVSIIERAISDKEEDVFFSVHLYSSTINDLGQGVERIKVKTQSLDDHFASAAHKPTFIKFDIEYSEMAGLIGAEKTIDKYKPKLAISIYHNLEDLWEIPHYLMKKYPFFDFYIRHHQISTVETILYAIPK